MSSWISARASSKYLLRFSRRDLTRTLSEETSEDVRARMHAIQENEIDQLRELSRFLEMEIRFAEQYMDVLRGVKEDWIDEYVVISSTAQHSSNSHTA